MDEWRDIGVVRGDEGRRRCGWCTAAPEYVVYHDAEWGRPVVDDVLVYQKLCLEGFQSGLSWLTILRKRKAFRSAFDGFVPEQVARFGRDDVERLLSDVGIVRHRGKIEAAIANAPGPPSTCSSAADRGRTRVVVRAVSPTSARTPSARRRSGRHGGVQGLSRELRRLGFRFVGPTTSYAAMQSLGVVNDPLSSCRARSICTAERRALRPPRPAA